MKDKQILGRAGEHARNYRDSISDRPPPRRAAFIGLVVIVALVVGGLLLVHVLKKTSQIQDCVMSGRTNCAPIP